jgi:hypothetical protein
MMVLYGPEWVGVVRASSRNCGLPRESAVPLSALKTGVRATVPWVRIPLPRPLIGRTAMTTRQLVGIAMILIGAVVVGTLAAAFPGSASSVVAVSIAVLFDLTIVRWVTDQEPTRAERAAWASFEAVHAYFHPDGSG